MDRCRADLLRIYRSAIHAVNGRRCVSDWLMQHPEADFRHVVAIGKAAAAMTAGVLDVLGERIDTALVITRHGHADRGLATDGRVQQYEAGHPLPDQRSLVAGQRLMDFLAASASGAPLLFLISGGASALVEMPAAGLTLTELQRANAWLLGSGLPIAAVNAVRIALSAIKGGRLTRYLSASPATALLISDVPGDNPAVIGSGPLRVGAALVPLPPLPDWLRRLVDQAEGVPGDDQSGVDVPHYIIADAGAARRAACSRARSLGYTIVGHDQLITGDVLDTAAAFAATLQTGPPALHIWSGETTVLLPENPGTGGRCQSLALALVQLMPTNAFPWWFLAGATDGNDGAGAAAGALVDANSLARIANAGLDAQHCLRSAAATNCLRAASDLLLTGPTGTNVMDTMMALRY